MYRYSGVVSKPLYLTILGCYMTSDEPLSQPQYGDASSRSSQSTTQESPCRILLSLDKACVTETGYAGVQATRMDTARRVSRRGSVEEKTGGDGEQEGVGKTTLTFKFFSKSISDYGTRLYRVVTPSRADYAP